ncbi:conserved hypothetical protein [Ricinus communis]|uniref:RING-type domain-containing protein n=1 Tax=Ricinus communis TaxID=3988 RepID=B9SM79_RICCO|nr:conserved hypothetical protein [Ricinus communis]
MSRTIHLDLCTKPSTMQAQEHPVFCLQLSIHHKYRRLWRNCEGQVREAQSYTAPPSSALFQIQPSALARASTCHAQIHEFLSSLNVHHALRLFLAPKIATSLLSLSREQLLLGFHAVADSEILREEFLEPHEQRGVSRSTLRKLKKERFSAATAAEGGGISGDCAICLEEFGGEVKLIKMPCAHNFS